MYAARVAVRLKPGILDPQGVAIEHALHALQFETAADVRTGKLIDFTIEASDEPAAEAKVRKACEQLLANPVIEAFDFRLSEA